MGAALYSPRRRTGLLLCGTGTAGAYQAGVLNALAEAGVKIDLVAAHGAGVLNALCAAADGTAVLADGGGPWTRVALRRAYRWRPALRIAGAGLMIVLLLLVSPGLLLVVAGAAYAGSLLASLANLQDTAAWLVQKYGETLQIVLNPPIVPTLVPRAMVLGLIVVAGVLVSAAIRAAWEERSRRRLRGAFWWRLVGAPLGGEEPGGTLVDALWRLVRGASGGTRPDAGEMGRRYVELVGENLGQPGFRELLIAVHDLDARRDIVGAVLGPESGAVFAARRAGAGPREAEAIDLTGAHATLLVDLLHGSLRLPVATPPQPVLFPSDSYWRGELHHVCDRPDLAGRLLEEMIAAGVEQIVLVGAAPSPLGPHSLRARPMDLRSRVGAAVRSMETAAFDAIWARALGVTERVFVIRPVHNPIGPFDFGGVYDEASDRHRAMPEFVRQGYDDAYQQFIEPVVAGGRDGTSS
jgi:hypothetical protein